MNLKDIEILKKRFREIVLKYDLDKDEKAEEIAKFLTSYEKNKVSPKEFKELFNFEDIQEAEDFLKFIDLGLRFKEKAVK